MVTNLLPAEVIEPEDVSSTIAVLVTNDARYITGVALPVDAGLVKPTKGIDSWLHWQK